MMRADALKNADAFLSIQLSNGEALKRNKRFEKNFPLFLIHKGKNKRKRRFLWQQT